MVAELKKKLDSLRNIYHTRVISKGPLTIYENIDLTNKRAIQIVIGQNVLPKFEDEGRRLFTVTALVAVPKQSTEICNLLNRKKKKKLRNLL